MDQQSASKYFTVEVEGHGSKLLHNLNRARLEKRFCDFKIQVGKQVIHAHKNVLTEGCEYFRAMLSHPMKESNEGFVEMVDVNFESLEICIEYIYLGKTEVKKKKLQSLLEVAHRLQLNAFCEEAAKHLGDDLSLETFFTTNSVAVSLELKNLRKKCNDFALENLPGIALQEDFVKIDFEYLEFLMTAKVSPAMKCKTFLVWANHDADNRGKQFEEFFLNLDLDQFPSSYMAFLEQNEALFFNSNKCLRKFMETKLPISAAKDIDLGSFRNAGEFNKFAVFDKTSKAILAYDPDQDTWTELHKMTSEISRLKFVAVVIGDDIFVFGEDQHNWKLRYSDKKSTWSSLPNRTITWKVGAAEVDGLIYAFDETNAKSKAVEVYDGSEWSHVTDKPVAGYQTYIVAVDGSIYCIGGYTGGIHDGSTWQYHSHCNKYETKKKCWTTLPSMPEKSSCGCATELDRKIYVIGGIDNNDDAVASCFVFDIETEAWSDVAGMTNPRYHFRAIPILGKIFAIGGVKSHNTVEEFDPWTGKWRTVMSLGTKKIVATASVALKSSNIS